MVQGQIGRRARRQGWRAGLLVLLTAVGLLGLASCELSEPLLSGSVSSANGTRLAGVEIALYSDEDTRAAATSSDVAGQYRFADAAVLPDGTYRLMVDGRFDAPDGSWSGATTVTIDAGVSATRDIVVQADPAVVVLGVVEADGVPRPEAAVALTDAADGSWLALVVTDAAGAFRFELLEAGDVRVSVAADDHPLVQVGGSPGEVIAVQAGDLDLGTIEITTGVRQPPPPTYKGVAAGWEHTCVIRMDDTVSCWGHSLSGVSPTGTFTSLAAGSYGTCGTRTDGTVHCWGTNDYGQSTPPAGTYRSISARANHRCAVATDGTLRCWGETSNGLTSPPAGTFKTVHSGFFSNCATSATDELTCWGLGNQGELNPPAGPVKGVALGAEFGCAIVADDSVDCWGKAGSSTNNVPSGSFTQLTAGSYHVCGLRSDQTVSCWGDNSAGAVASPSGTLSTVSAGVQHTCGLRTDGTLACWGLNNRGQATAPTS